MRLFVMTLAVGIMLFSPSSLQAGNVKAGDGFRIAAKEYQKQAIEHKNKGYHHKARIFERLAKFKNRAAVLADQGHWDKIDWTKYNELSQSLNK